jgi:DNA-binding transcriptional LysR family regulator
VAITTWASFAAMWLIPRLEDFQRQHPDIDIRIDTTDSLVDLETTDVDLAIRYSRPGRTARRDRAVWRAAGRGRQPWLLQSATARAGRRIWWAGA